MNIDRCLIDSFKANCPQEMQEILNCSYIKIPQRYDAFKLPTDPGNPLSICQIYSAVEGGQKLILHRKQLKEIAKRVGIQSLNIFPVTRKDLALLKRKATITNDPKDWKNYLTFLYLF